MPHPKPLARNPRRISKKRLAMLRASMAEHGDLGGIVVGADKSIISGNQRWSAHAAENPKPIIEMRHNTPTPAGTTAEGYVMLGGERFSYRETNWTGHKAMVAATAANTPAGAWDEAALAEVLRELAAVPDLIIDMWEPEQLAPYLDGPPPQHSDVDHPPIPSADDDAPHAPGDTPGMQTISFVLRNEDAHLFTECVEQLKDITGMGALGDVIFTAVKKWAAKSLST